MRIFSGGWWKSSRARNTLKGLAFISPWILGYLGFTIYPILASGYYSLTRYDVIRPARFIGLENYVEAFTTDETFRLVIKNTLFMVFIGVPAALVTAFLLASLLNNEMKIRPLFRTIFFLPTLMPAVVTAEVWRWVYNTNWGLINSVLRALERPVIPFLSSETMAKPSLVIIQCWTTGTAMILFLAALQDVPRSLYDAAVVDGANAPQRFWHVTIPMCTPAILFVLLTSMIGTFQYFSLGWLLTQGGPNRATEFFSIYLYRNAFVFFKMGYASALAWILFVIILILTIVVFRSSARWVYYGGEAR
jgi:multiple sugar transport system permease protein